MKFLESLYSIENFGIYLFVIIGMLVVLFLVILFFGKKDEKKRKEQEQPVQEENAFKEVSTASPLEPSKIMEETIIEPVNNIPVMETEEKKEEVIESQEFTSPAPEKEFDFDALAAAISKELESIDSKSEEIKPVVEETKEVTIPMTQEISEPVLTKVEESPLQYIVEREATTTPILKEEPRVILEPVMETEPKKVEELIKEEKKVMPRPTVFSSVYVNRNVEEPKIMEEQKNIAVEEIKEKEVEIVPIAPKIELPKMMDLPRRK